MSCVNFSDITGRKQRQTKRAEKRAKEQETRLEAYQLAGGRITAGFDSTAAAAAASVPATVGITPQKDIVWAPENPEEDFAGGQEQIWQSPENVSWHVSYPEALQQARETGKPILIWFTNSVRSPHCRALSNELFSGPSFESWASKSIVRLRVDSAIPGSRKGEDDWTKKNNYIEKLKKKYKVQGNPTVIILSPSGGSIAKYRGYKLGNAENYWGRMKSAVGKAEDDYGAWREKLEARGYRLWTNRQGRKTFAKLYRFKAGKVILIDPDGKRGTTSLNKLSDADQAWIISEKQKYDQRRGG